MDSLDDAIFRFENPSKDYIVGLFGSRIMPYQSTTHHWFVVQSKDTRRRVEVLGHLLQTKPPGNHSGLIYSSGNEFEGIYTNFLKYANPFIPSSTYPTTNFGIIEGGRNSLAHRLSFFILEKSFEYPYLDKYVPSPGPNSNTFTEWVLRQRPKSRESLVLPSTAHGKDYQRRERVSFAAE